MTTHCHVRQGMVLVSSLFGVGCGRPAGAPSPTAAPGLTCDHGYAVAVLNNTHSDVDIVQFTAGHWTYVTTVTARTTREVPLPSGDRVEWRWLPSVPQYDPDVSIEVTLHMHCN
jgi:hypothetical protein